MAYADYAYYTGTYKGNSIPEADFDRLILRAGSYLDRVSGDTVKATPDDTSVKMAACAVAEAWQVNEQGGDVVSQSVGPWSKTFQKATKTDDDRLFEAARLYLGSRIKRGKVVLMFPHTVTVYNKYKDAAGVEKWKRTVLSGVFWDSSRGAIIRKTGVASADGLLLIVPMGVTVADKSAYKKPKEWEALPDKTGSWTLQEGDTVILGDISYEVVKSSRELQQFDDVLEITNVDTRNYGGGMDLWEVTGK